MMGEVEIPTLAAKSGAWMGHPAAFFPLGFLKKQLREVDVQGVDILRAEVVDVETGVVGGLAAP
jgi:hypothetical protein